MVIRTPTLGLLFVALSYSWLCGYNSFSGCSQFLNDTHHLNNQQKNFKSSDVSFNLSTGVYSGRCTFLRRRFSKGRVLYTTNCSSSFNPFLLTITLSGDVHPQPRLGQENNNMRPKKAQQRSTRNVTVAHLNVRSIRSRENFYLFWQMTTDNCLDILTVSKSWQDPSIDDSDLQIPGYFCFGKIVDHLLAAFVSASRTFTGFLLLAISLTSPKIPFRNCGLMSIAKS